MDIEGLTVEDAWKAVERPMISRRVLGPALESTALTFLQAVLKFANAHPEVTTFEELEQLFRDVSMDAMPP